MFFVCRFESCQGVFFLSVSNNSTSRSASTETFLPAKSVFFYFIFLQSHNILLLCWEKTDQIGLSAALTHHDIRRGSANFLSRTFINYFATFSSNKNKCSRPQKPISRHISAAEFITVVACAPIHFHIITGKQPQLTPAVSGAAVAAPFTWSVKNLSDMKCRFTLLI